MENLIKKDSYSIHYIMYMGILLILTATILCSTYIILIYQDVAGTYNKINNGNDILKEVNITHLIKLVNDLNAFEECFTSKFCNRKQIGF